MERIKLLYDSTELLLDYPITYNSVVNLGKEKFKLRRPIIKYLDNDLEMITVMNELEFEEAVRNVISNNKYL